MTTRNESLGTAEQRIGGYRVVRRLATGGTSDVLLAKAEGPHGFERTVVLKLLLSQFRNDTEFARMFAREASAYARLAHPAIVRLFDFFALPPTSPGAAPSPGNRDGQLVMVLEHVDGPALSRLRSLLKAAKRELDDQSAIYIASRIFDALAAAHATIDENGNTSPVIHRDVNPSNVLVPWDGHVKLADFGVAKVTGLNHQSVAGMIKGTYGYMAPEQVTGEAVTPRADVYAAAIVLWELLAKRKAFQRGALPEVEALRAMAEPRLPSIETIRPDVDKAVRDAMKRALEPRAERRTITAEEMVSILTTVVKRDEGRERLVSLMAGIRSDAQAVSLAYRESPYKDSEAPPPPPATAGIVFRPGSLVPSTVPEQPRVSGSASTSLAPPVTQPGGVGMPGSAGGRGMLPRSAGRGGHLSRMTADYGPEPVTPNPAAAQPPPLPPRKPPLPPSSPKLPTTTLSSTSSKDGVGGAGGPRLGIPTVPNAPAVLAEPPKRPSAAQRLAAVSTAPVPPEGNKKAVGGGGLLPAGGVKLYDAIDDILKDVPSSQRPPPPPPQPSPEEQLKETAKSPPAKLVEEKSPQPPRAAAGKPLVKTMAMGSMPHASGELPTPAVAFGRLPNAPDPLQSTTLIPTGSAPPDKDPGPELPSIPAQDFGAKVKELGADNKASTTQILAPTPRMPPVQERELAAQERTLAMDVRPLVESSPEGEPKAVPSDLPKLFSPAPPAPPPLDGEFSNRHPSTGKMPVYAAARGAYGPAPVATGAGAAAGGQQGQQGRETPAGTQVMQAVAPIPPPVPSPQPIAAAYAQPPSPTGSGPHASSMHESNPDLSAHAAQAAIASATPPSPPKKSNAPLIAIALLVLTAAGVAGSVMLVRYQRAQATTTTPTTSTTTTTTTATTTTPATPSVSIATTETATAPSGAAASPPSASVAASASSESASASAPASASASASGAAPSGDIPPDMGVVKTAGAAPHRRIFVEEKVVGQTPESVTIKCGPHAIRLGSSGKTQQIDVPCGGEITVGDKDK